MDIHKGSPPPPIDSPVITRARWLINQWAEGFEINDDFLRDFGADVINSVGGRGEISPEKVMALIQYTRMLEDNL